MVKVLIMAGGRGERFWPKSRKENPKQFLSLNGNGSLILDTVNRIKGYVSYRDIYVVTLKEYEERIRKLIPEIPQNNIIVEPVGKNTAACIGLSLLHMRDVSDPTVIVLPSDHYISDNRSFVSTLKKAVEVSERVPDTVITIGIRPTRPETGYGYIKRKKEKVYLNTAYAVERFVEKPKFETALFYLRSGDYLWNSGIFIFKKSTMEKALKEYMPSLWSGLVRIREAMGREDFKEVLEREYSKFENISIDYGVMEKYSNIAVIPAAFSWDDLGSWRSLERIMDKDEDGNVILGNVVCVDTKNSIVESNGRLVALVGVEDMIVVDTHDAVLVCRKDRDQSIKDLLKVIRERNFYHLL